MPKHLSDEMDKIANTLDKISDSGDEIAEKQFDSSIKKSNVVKFMVV